MNRWWVGVIVLSVCGGGARAADDVYTLMFAEAAITAHAARLKAVEAEYEAAVKKAAAARAQSVPRISIDGQYRWVAHVSELSLPSPLAGSVRLGDDHAYSIGATASWLAWDRGGKRAAYRGAQAAASGLRAEADAVRRRVLLAGRSAYFTEALAREHAAILEQTVALSASQAEDIARKARAGTKSRMDAIGARQELLRRMRQFRQAQADEAQALRTLVRLTGWQGGAEHPPLLENMNSLLLRRRDPKALRLKTDHPDAQAFMELAAAARYAQAGFESGLWPTLSVQARSSLEYPDMALREQYTQHTAAVALAWPLFEGGQSRAQAAASRWSATAADSRAEEAREDVQAAWGSSMDLRSALEDQQKIDAEIVDQAQELAQITLAAYNAGTADYFQVADANLKALESRMALARTIFQLLVNDAVLTSMAEE